MLVLEIWFSTEESISASQYLIECASEGKNIDLRIIYFRVTYFRGFIVVCATVGVALWIITIADLGDTEVDEVHGLDGDFIDFYLVKDEVGRFKISMDDGEWFFQSLLCFLFAFIFFEEVIVQVFEDENTSLEEVEKIFFFHKTFDMV